MLRKIRLASISAFAYAAVFFPAAGAFAQAVTDSESAPDGPVAEPEIAESPGIAIDLFLASGPDAPAPEGATGILLGTSSPPGGLGPVAGITGGMMDAHTFNDIARNTTTSLEELPALLSGTGYLLGMLLGVQGILKIRQHVEMPEQIPVKLGAVRLLAGGALFALPIIYEAMFQTVGTTAMAGGVEAAPLNVAQFSIR